MTEEQRIQILARAEEIQSQASVRLTDNAAVDQLVLAAEEAGLDREAVLQALRERVALSERPFAPEDLVFAKSADGHFYPAHVKKVDGGTVDVEFVNGSHATVERSSIQHFSALPGQVLNCQWPNWGWWDGRVLSYDRKREMVHVSDGWGSEQWFFINDVRIRPEPGPKGLRAKAWMNYVAISLASGALGALIMRLIMR